MTPAELHQRIGAGTAPAILDVRTAEEFGEGHVPGAVNIPVEQLPDRIAEVPAARDGELVVYCRTGLRAQAAMEILAGQGFTRLLGLEGNLPGWQAAMAPAAPAAADRAPAQSVP